MALTDDQRTQLEHDLPPVMSRKEVARLFPGLISVGGLANLDSQGRGPRRIHVGGKVGYTKRDFLTWLCQRSEAA